MPLARVTTGPPIPTGWPMFPGWQAERIDNFNGFVNFAAPEDDLVADGWTALATRLTGQHLVDVPVQELP